MPTLLQFGDVYSSLLFGRRYLSGDDILLTLESIFARLPGHLPSEIYSPLPMDCLRTDDTSHLVGSVACCRSIHCKMIRPSAISRLASPDSSLPFFQMGRNGQLLDTNFRSGLSVARRGGHGFWLGQARWGRHWHLPSFWVFCVQLQGKVFERFFHLLNGSHLLSVSPHPRCKSQCILFTTSLGSLRQALEPECVCVLNSNTDFVVPYPSPLCF